MPASRYPDPADFHFPPATEAASSPCRPDESLWRGLAHKLNNQISVVHGFASLMMMQDTLDHASRENVGHMKQAANQMAGILGKVLFLAGVQSNTPQRVDLNVFFAGLHAPLHNLMDMADVPCALDIRPDLPAVIADPARLREMIIELWKNAADAAGSDGQVAMDVFGPGLASPPESRQVDIFIRNSGRTIPPEKLPSIFEPFASSKGSEHPGLGLPTAVRIAASVGGRLGLRSTNDTTTVWIVIPVAG